MARPLGVTILGAGMILAGLGFAAAGIIFFFMGSTGATATAPENGAMATVLAALGAAAGVVFLLFGALHVVLAIAIFQLRNLARILTHLFVSADCRRSVPRIDRDAGELQPCRRCCGTFPSSWWICWRYGICGARDKGNIFASGSRLLIAGPRLPPSAPRGRLSRSRKGKFDASTNQNNSRRQLPRAFLDGREHLAPRSPRRHHDGSENSGIGRAGPRDRRGAHALRSQPSGNQRDGGLFRVANGRHSKGIHPFGFRPVPSRPRARLPASHRGHGRRQDPGRDAQPPERLRVRARSDQGAAQIHLHRPAHAVQSSHQLLLQRCGRPGHGFGGAFFAARSN